MFYLRIHQVNFLKSEEVAKAIINISIKIKTEITFEEKNCTNIRQGCSFELYTRKDSTLLALN